MLDGIFSAAASHVNASMQGLGQIIGQAWGFKQQKELAKYQNDMNIANWQMQNEYNHPAAQMERYKQAGINPNLVAGNTGAGTAGALPSYPSVNAPDYGSAIASAFQSSMSNLGTLMNVLNAEADNRIKKATERNIEAQTENVEANTANTRANTDTTLWNYVNMLPLNRTRLQKDISKIGNEIILLSLQSQGQLLKNRMSRYNLDYILPLDRALKSVGLHQAQYNLNFLSPAQTAKLWADIALSRSRKQLTDTDVIWNWDRNLDAPDYWKQQQNIQNVTFQRGLEALTSAIIENNIRDQFGSPTLPGFLSPFASLQRFAPKKKKRQFSGFYYLSR